MIFSEDDPVLENLKNRHKNLHPLVFHRSVEKARDLANLFDILEDMPKKYPIIWDEKSGSWTQESDFMLKKRLKDIKKK